MSYRVPWVPDRRGQYLMSPETAPIRYWDLWAPIFNQLGISPSDIPDFAPLAAPQGEGLPAWQRGTGIYEANTGGGLLAPNQSQQQQQLQLLRGLLDPSGGMWT